MLSIIRSCILKQTKSSIALLSGITAASLSSMAAVQGVDFHKEAVWLSSKASQLGNVKLHAVVKEDIDNEIEDFREFFTGDIHLDEKKDFYGPIERVGGFSQLMSFKMLSTYRKIQLTGNTLGEGWIMGGVLVVGPGEQGILYEHIEAKVAERCDIDKVMEAVGKISQ